MNNLQLMVKEDQRFLLANIIISDEDLDILKNETLIRYKNRPASFEKEYLDKYLQWSKQANQIALFTLYTYAELEIPIHFNCLFNFNNPNEFSVSEFIVTQSIFEGFYPINKIERGCKHLLVCEFSENTIPEIINKLSISKYKSSEVPQNQFDLGICNYSDFRLITERINYRKALKEKYGNKWMEYEL